ncbi:uncharacterized protein KRP23_4755 [Phytophthora ramorum]|uniref:uncharacterized protein n=1 Tax=Phytophthora ramorum TaxID=164328 RepID=UPI00309EC548|nr:hypothetical protein KRP23_4755 [Phytophthora ramorum]
MSEGGFNHTDASRNSHFQGVPRRDSEHLEHLDHWCTTVAHRLQLKSCKVSANKNSSKAQQSAARLQPTCFSLLSVLSFCQLKQSEGVSGERSLRGRHYALKKRRMEEQTVEESAGRSLGRRNG